MKKVLSILLALCLMVGLSGCGLLFGGGEDDLVDPDTGAIYPDRWYTTKAMAGIETYNCVVTDAFARAAGGIFATYVPFCRECHEQGVTLNAILDSETPYETSSYCSDCGARTSTIIRYNP